MDSRIKVIKQIRNPKTGVMVPLIDVNTLVKMVRKAQKIKPVWGMPAELAIGKVKKLVKLDAIEGYETMAPGSWITKGEIGEPWFQDSRKMFKAYEPEFTDEEGWTKLNPMPDVWRWATLVESKNGFAIYAEWGDKNSKDGSFPNGVERVAQFSSGTAAYVINEPSDQYNWWLVVPSLFLQTYAWI